MDVDVDADRPWLARYPPHLPADIVAEHATPLTMLRHHVEHRPDDPALLYFDGTTTWAELDQASDALAALLVMRRFRAGDRLALLVQNDPAFVVGLLAAWKAGGAAVLVSPMCKHRELDDLLRDSAPVALLALDDLYEDVARAVLADGAHEVHTVVTLSALDGQSEDDPRLFARTTRRLPPDTLDLARVVSTGARPPRRDLPGPDDLAVLAYTSGTTGFAKGAMLTHANLSFNAQTYRDWAGLGRDDRVLALAPVFHVTGLVGGVVLGLLLGSPLVLAHRFHAASMVDVVRRHRPAFAVAAITAYLGLADDGGARPEDLASLRWVCSGGAPVEPHVAADLEQRLGHYVHNVYGQTETTSPSHMVPLGTRAPVDDATGALSVGLPVFNTRSRVVDDDGSELPAGEIGELVTSGPQTAAGYWHRPDVTREAFVADGFRTGDVGFRDTDGWFFVVDRRNDLINAAGFKVWPREVEQVLQLHPAVREAAVVGIPDDYRGESVKAFVALEPGSTASELDLIDHCRARLAAYKYPREVEVVTELPRTATGKVMRRTLRGRR